MSRAAEPSALPTGTIAGLAVLEVAGGGPPVVLVPGYTGSKEDFDPVLGELGRRAVAIDLPGQYESPGPPDPSAYSTERLGARVLEVARELGAPVHLVGHSFGGLVCRSAARQEPSLVASVVLLCSGPGAIPPPRRWDIELLVTGTPGKGMPEVWDVVTAFRAEQGSEPPTGFAARRWLASTPEGLVGMGRAVLDEEDGIGHFAALRIPSIVVTGELDDAWPVGVQAEMAARLGCEQVLIPGAAHSPAVETPGACAEVLRRWMDGQRL